MLTDISFVAEPGQSVALVGHTGSGKTTLVALLQKFYLPASGRVLVDGFDLNSVTSDSLRSQMGSVQQNNFLFAGSVLDNIRFARPEATEADVRATLEALDCLDLLDALPQKLHTLVAERGHIAFLWPAATGLFRARDAGEPAHRGVGRGDERD